MIYGLGPLGRALLQERGDALSLILGAERKVVQAPLELVVSAEVIRF